jgi:hypothetical protein
MDFAFHDKKTSSEEVRMLGLVGAKRIFKWIRKDYIQEQDSLSKYKVLISESNGASGTLGDTAARLISTPLIGDPFTAHTDTFLTVGAFETEVEANAVLKYIKTKFARVLLGVLKVTQHNSRSTWAKVPLQDFTPHSDIDWSKSVSEIDKQLYVKYGLDEKEIAFIEEKVTAME